MTPQIQILLSTFNGAFFLKEQMDSILGQTYTDWQLLVQDDGSTDETLAIIKAYCDSHGDKIVHVHGKEGGGSSQSFFNMLSLVKAPYCMFCDQDDVWERDKIERSLKSLQTIKRFNPVALVFTDMEIVSEDLSQSYGSFLQGQKLKPEWAQDKNNVLAQSMAAGCTMLFTKQLIDVLKPIKAPLFQHDQWLMIHVALFGKIVFCDAKTMKYRQHSANAVGSHSIGWSYFSKKVKEVSKVLQRWQYLKSQFGSQVSILKVFKAKIRLNYERL